MNRTLLIIRREFFTRIRKRSFIILTLLGPLLISGVFIIPIWLSSQTGEHKIIEVWDASGLFEDEFVAAIEGKLIFAYKKLDEPIIDQSFPPLSEDHFGRLYIPPIDVLAPGGITFYADQQPGLGMTQQLANILQVKLERLRLDAMDLSVEQLEQIKEPIVIDTIVNKKSADSQVATAVGYIGALLIYFLVFYYGAQVMRGVAEEKNNRIVEIMLCTVKPFQLMIGKIVGIAGVGLLQFVLWGCLSGVFILGFSTYAQLDRFDQQQIEQTMTGMQGQDALQAIELNQLMTGISAINFPLILACFLVYFMGAYLLYSAMFAALGAALDADTDSQQFMFPVVLPILFAILSLSTIGKDPHGQFATWLSLMPFTSPVAMLMRIPFGVATWQLILSMLLLVGAFIGMTWLAAKIYRIGILMHGAKVNYRIIAKWIVQ